MAETAGPSSGAGRRGAWAAFWTLALLVSSAIYAPFLANDKPYYLRAIDLRALRTAAATLEPLTLEWWERVSSSGYEPGGPQAFEALDLRLGALERPLDPDSELGGRVQRARAAVRAADASARRLSSVALERALVAKTELGELGALVAPALPEPGSPPGEPWRAATSWPLLESLGWWEGWLALSWPLALAWLALRPAARLALAGGAVALLASLLLAWCFHPPASLATRSLKAAITRGDVHVERVVFAPVPYGYDETNLSEALRPPTWSASAEIDAGGRYVRGPRATPPGHPQPAATPVEIRAGEPPLNGSRRHWLGADSLGRDVLTRLVWGGRVSLGVAFSAVALLLVLGLVFGLVAGYARGVFDALFLAVVQVLQSFPSFFLILVAVALFSARGVHPQWATAVVIGLVGWTGVARLVRAETLAIRELDYVLAARALGLGEARVLLRHVAPGAVAPAIVAGAFALGSAILAESAASFLGFGVRPPVPSWGALLRESSAVEHWWILLFPGLAVFATVACANRLGDALREALDLREVAP